MDGYSVQVPVHRVGAPLSVRQLVQVHNLCPPMTWWYVTSDMATCLVEEKNGVITDAAPIFQRFVGQPAKNLGDWLRTKGDVEFKRIRGLTHVYVWKNNSKRETLSGRPCRIIAKGTMRSVLIEFPDGQREIVSVRSLRLLTSTLA